MQTINALVSTQLDGGVYMLAVGLPPEALEEVPEAERRASILLDGRCVIVKIGRRGARGITPPKPATCWATSGRAVQLAAKVHPRGLTFEATAAGPDWHMAFVSRQDLPDAFFPPAPAAEAAPLADPELSEPASRPTPDACLSTALRIVNAAIDSRRDAGESIEPFIEGGRVRARVLSEVIL